MVARLLVCAVLLLRWADAIPVDNDLLLTRKLIESDAPAETVCSSTTTTDLLFVIDGSTSIGPENFELLRQFLSLIASDLPDGSQIGAVQFSGSVRTEFSFNTFGDLNDVADYFLTMPYQMGTTRIGNALDYALKEELTAKAGNRPDVPDIVLVITDGRSSDDPGPAADRIRATGASTIALGITQFVDDEQLLAVAGSNATAFKVEQFDKLDAALKDAIVSSAVCVLVTQAPHLGDPSLDIDCGSNSITIGSPTRNPFEGSVFVKNHFADENCRKDGVPGNSYADIELGFDDCDVLNPRGVFVETTVVFQFHPKFVTKVDRAFKVQCFYMEADKTVSTDLEVSMLTTSEITQQFPMPTCQYSIHEGSAEGPVVRFAIVGQAVYHVWSCDNSVSEDLFRMRVHSCFVGDGQGDRVDLLDEDGCAIDKFLLRNLDYADGAMLASVEAHVFKFADRPQLYFQCQIELCVDIAGGCPNTPPQNCSAANNRLRRQTSLDWSDDAVAAVDVFTDTLTIADAADLGDLAVAATAPRDRPVALGPAVCLTHVELFLFVAVSFGTFVLMAAISVAVHIRSPSDTFLYLW